MARLSSNENAQMANNFASNIFLEWLEHQKMDWDRQAKIVGEKGLQNIVQTAVCVCGFDATAAEVGKYCEWVMNFFILIS